MYKIRIVTLGLVIALLSILAVGSNPPAEARYYSRIHFDPGILSASYLGDGTEIRAISLIDNEGDNYNFTATGQVILNIPENRLLTTIYTLVVINDNYASTNSEAQNRTRVDLTLTDPDNVKQYENVLGGTGGTVLHFADYYILVRVYGCSILMTSGTWILDAEYEIFAIPP